MNSWGIARDSTGPWWVADNKTGFATIYDQNGVAVPPTAVGVSNSPTGIVANETSSFNSAPFILASESGEIRTSTGGPAPVTTAGAVYKGLAISPSGGSSRLYVTNFNAGKVEVYDAGFNFLFSFSDPNIPDGFAPFGIRVIGDTVYVTYAKQNTPEKNTEVAGAELGYVDAFTKEGALDRRIASQGKLNAPWGLALAPPDFCQFPNHLLVGNFGDGKIIAFNIAQNNSAGTYLGDNNGPFVIDGLWGLDFGNGGTAGPSSTLFFAAGPANKAHGLFGRLDCGGVPCSPGCPACAGCPPCPVCPGDQRCPPPMPPKCDGGCPDTGSPDAGDGGPLDGGDGGSLDGGDGGSLDGGDGGSLDGGDGGSEDVRPMPDVGPKVPDSGLEVPDGGLGPEVPDSGPAPVPSEDAGSPTPAPTETTTPTPPPTETPPTETPPPTQTPPT